MKTSELSRKIFELIEAETEINRDKIISRSKSADVVDARHLFIYVTSRAGVYASKIADILGITPRAVQYAVTDFDTRMLISPSLRECYERIAKKLGRNYEATAK